MQRSTLSRAAAMAQGVTVLFRACDLLIYPRRWTISRGVGRPDEGASSPASHQDH